jgi:hypothetical protein
VVFESREARPWIGQRLKGYPQLETDRRSFGTGQRFDDGRLFCSYIPLKVPSDLLLESGYHWLRQACRGRNLAPGIGRSELLQTATGNGTKEYSAGNNAQDSHGELVVTPSPPTL